MRYDDLTLVFQGMWNDRTIDNIAMARRAMPGAAAILSTWEHDRHKVRGAPVDAVVFSRDPGALAPYRLRASTSHNNTNRQIVSTAAGMALVTSTLAIKLRTDCTLLNDAAGRIFRAMCDAEPAHPRIVASSFYTLHPRGIEALPFHISDWFQLGRSADLRDYWRLPLVTETEATWFGQRPHAREASYFARQYRSRFAPEQTIAVAYAAHKGYAVPASVDERNSTLAAESERFMANEFVICEPHVLGLSFPKYAGVSRSHYQAFNCVSGADWLAFRGRAASLPALPPSLAEAIAGGPAIRPPCARRHVAGFFRRIDRTLPFLKRFGLMPVVGNALAIFR